MDVGPPDPERRERETLLLRRVAAGGRDGNVAMKALFRAYQPKFIRLLARSGMSSEQALDVTQAAWEDIWRKAGEFPEGATPSTWIYAFVDIARKRSQKAWVTSGKRTVSSDDEANAEAMDKALANLSPPTPEHDTALAALRRCVEEAWNRFKRLHATGAWLLRLRHLDDMPLEQLADYRSSTIGATSEYLAQLRRKAKPFLKHCLERSDDG